MVSPVYHVMPELKVQTLRACFMIVARKGALRPKLATIMEQPSRRPDPWHWVPTTAMFHRGGCAGTLGTIPKMRKGQVSRTGLRGSKAESSHLSRQSQR